MRRLIPMPSPNATNLECLYISVVNTSRGMAYDAANGRRDHFRILSRAETLRHAQRLTRRLLARDQASEPDDDRDDRELSESDARAVGNLSDYCKENMSTAGILQLIEALNQLVEGEEDEPAEDDEDNMGSANMKPANMRSRGEDKRRGLTADDEFFGRFPEARHIGVSGAGPSRKAARRPDMGKDRQRLAMDKSRDVGDFFDRFPEARRIKTG
jgi:hypothetical protein